MKRVYQPTVAYQAKIQIRPTDEKVYSFVKSELKKTGNKINQEFQMKDGIDLYVASGHGIFGICKKFKRVFRGEVKTTFSLTTLDVQAGKKVNRLTALLRCKKPEEDITKPL
nr:hypothetical protein [Nanoarchaeum sp.]